MKDEKSHDLYSVIQRSNKDRSVALVRKLFQYWTIVRKETHVPSHATEKEGILFVRLFVMFMIGRDPTALESTNSLTQCTHANINLI